MEAVIGTVTGAVAAKILPKLLDFLREKHKLRGKLEYEIQYIKDESAMICAAIREDSAHPPSSGDEVYKAWIQMVRNLAYAIDDCIDRFMHRVAPVTGASWLRRKAHDMETMKARNEFASEICRLRKMSEDASALRTKYTTGVYYGRGAWESGSGAPETETDTTVSAAGLPVPAVGMDTALDELMELIRGTSMQGQQPKVISIVGFGGIGKTLLARHAYNSPAVVDNYPTRIWVSAAKKGAQDIFKEILQQLGGKEGTKRFFVVIDGMRGEFWHDIKDAFPLVPGVNNIVVVTTDTQAIANKCSFPDGHVYVMRTLAKEPSRKLLFEKACLLCPPPGDKELASEVLKKCDGLPLALVTAARLLHADPTREEWANLGENLGKHLVEINGNLASMNRVLVRSYTSLSMQDIKICLLYLGIYPSGRPIRRGSLLRRWLAERLITEDPTRSVLKVAVDNLDELVNKSIIQPIDASAKVKTCQTHGMMLEFILHNTENFVTLLYDKAPLPTNVRWLSLHNRTAARSKVDPSDFPRLRSLTIFGEVQNCMLDFSKYELMGVLDLEECGNQLEDKHLKVICSNLLLLRYLSLRGAATVTVIPKEIKKLKLLETLDVRGTNIKVLPTQAMKLPCLIHLFGKFIVEDRKMGKLRTWLEKNSKLQTVAGFVVDDKSHGFAQLMEHMDQLMKVKIWCVQSTNNSMDPIVTTSSNLSHLSKAIKGFITRSTKANEAHSLSLNFNDEWFQGLLVDLSLEKEDPSCYLSSLKLQGDNICSLPPFVTMLRGLTKLCLSSSPNHQLQLGGEILDALSRVCGLEYLKIIATHLVNLIIGPEALGSLRCLCVVVEVMTELEVQEGALPRLKSLQLLCKNLKGFFHAAMNQSLPRLNEVALHDGLSDETKKEWIKAVKNHPRRPKLLFVKTTEEVNMGSEPAETSESPAASTINMMLSMTAPHGAISTVQSVQVDGDVAQCDNGEKEDTDNIDLQKDFASKVNVDTPTNKESFDQEMEGVVGLEDQQMEDVTRCTDQADQDLGRKRARIDGEGKSMDKIVDRVKRKNPEDVLETRTNNTWAHG